MTFSDFNGGKFEDAKENIISLSAYFDSIDELKNKKPMDIYKTIAKSSGLFRRRNILHVIILYINTP